MKKLLKDYELPNMPAFYEMIIGSAKNGQFLQVGSQFSELDKPHKMDFIEYILESDLKELSNAIVRKCVSTLLR